MAEWLRQGPAKPCTRVRFPPPPRAISSVGERYLDTVEVTGSIPVSPTSTYSQTQGSRESAGSQRVGGPAPVGTRAHHGHPGPPRPWPVGEVSRCSLAGGRRRHRVIVAVRDLAEYLADRHALSVVRVRNCSLHYLLPSTARKASSTPARSLLIPSTIDPTGSVLSVIT